ncbi:MAG: hypothetical protein BWY76_00999 [bacterium ADurb.Bin429]|nr:MAG: hypothetical protein BWY76_00999 [bacterium ADurb.Bin429]
MTACAPRMFTGIFADPQPVPVTRGGMKFGSCSMCAQKAKRAFNAAFCSAVISGMPIIRSNCAEYSCIHQGNWLIFSPTLCAL